MNIRAGSTGRPTLGSLLRTAATPRVVGPLVIAVGVQSLGNLGFHAVVGRLLPADSYGALGAALAAMTMLAVPLGALQTAASALVAEHGLTGSTTLRVLRSVAMWAAIPAAVFLAGAPAVQAYLHLETWWDAALLGPYLLVAALGATARGLLLGDRQVGAVADTYLVGTAVRLGLGLSMVGPFGVSGALVGTLAGEVATLAATLERLASRARKARIIGTDRPAPLKLRAVLLAAVAVTGLFLFSTVDLLLARHYLKGADSGSYVAAATVAKTVLALPAAIISAVFPRLVAAWPTGGRTRLRALLAGGTVVICPALTIAAVMIAAPHLVLRLLYGSGYGNAAGLVQILSSIAALTSLVSLFTYAAVARHSLVLLMPWAGAALEIGLIELNHASAISIATASVASLVPTLLLIVAVEGRAWLRGLTVQRPQFVSPSADRLAEQAERPLPQGG